MNVKDLPYAEFLEEAIRSLAEHKAEKIVICAALEDGNYLTGYYGDCGPVDKAVMAHHINSDAMMDVIYANAQSIIQAAEEGEDDGE